MILFLSINDWANQGRTMAKAVRAAGRDAMHLTLTPLVFNALDGSDELIESMDHLKNAIDDATTIVFMHSNPHFVRLPIDTGDKKIAVFHGGSQYRNNPVMINQIFNMVVNQSLVQTADLLGLGAKNEKYINNGVDIQSIRETAGDERPNGKRIVIGYFPSNPATKGYGTVAPILNKIQQDYKGKVNIITTASQHPWEVNIKFMAKCHIVIDGVQPALGTKYYGEWGVQALEAAALGKVVFSHFRREDIYRKYLGGHCINACNNGMELYDKLTQMLDSSTKQKIIKRGRSAAAWCERVHALEPFGLRILEALK